MEDEETASGQVKRPTSADTENSKRLKTMEAQLAALQSEVKGLRYVKQGERLFTALSEGDFEEAEALIDAGDVDLLYKDIAFYTALFLLFFRHGLWPG